MYFPVGGYKSYFPSGTVVFIAGSFASEAPHDRQTKLDLGQATTGGIDRE